MEKSVSLTVDSWRKSTNCRLTASQRGMETYRSFHQMEPIQGSSARLWVGRCGIRRLPCLRSFVHETRRAFRTQRRACSVRQLRNYHSALGQLTFNACESMFVHIKGSCSHRSRLRKAKVGSRSRSKHRRCCLYSTVPLEVSPSALPSANDLTSTI